MKYIYTISFVLLLLFSCSDITESRKENVEFVSSDSINFENCKDLEGFAEFKINISTTKDIEKIFKSVQDPLKDYLRGNFEPSFSNGFSKIHYTDTLNSILLNETSIRQYDLCGLFGKYKIGDIEVDNIYLLCYNDTLIGVSIKSPPDAIIKAFISKYGDGKGSRHLNSVHFKDSKKNTISVSENRVWENETLIASYILMLESHPKLRSNELLVIQDKTGKIERYNSELSAIESRLSKEKKERREKAIEMI